MVTAAKPTERYGSHTRFFAALSVIAGLYFAFTVLALHFLPTRYDPIREVVSDYGVGSYGPMMDLGFAAAGIGGMALAFGLSRLNESRSVYRAGTALLFVAGMATLALGAFPIDLQGAAMTTRGTVHSVTALIVFTLQPVGMLLVSRTLGRRGFWLSLLALILAASVFVSVGTLSLNAAGLSERIFVTVISSWSLVVSIRLFRRASQIPP